MLICDVEDQNPMILKMSKTRKYVSHMHRVVHGEHQNGPLGHLGPK